MTYPMHYPNNQYPANYSGVTINITNPAFSTGGAPCNRTCPTTSSYQGEYQCNTPLNIPANSYQTPVVEHRQDYQAQVYPVQYGPYPQYAYNNQVQNEYRQTNENQYIDQAEDKEILPVSNNVENTISASPSDKKVGNNTSTKNNDVQTYPAGYYINNYNTNPIENKPEENNNTEVDKLNTNSETPNKIEEITEETTEKRTNPIENNIKEAEDTNNLKTSEEIIANLDSIATKEEELKNSESKKKIVALTNEYIMSLENYLNNPNKEIRLMAAEEVLTRFDEDRDRHNDAALNALINKMLQDPEKIIRIAAMSALSSNLASGNQYTVELLNKMQNDPKSTKEDMVESAKILLMMATSTEEKTISAVNPQNKTEENK